MLAIAPPLKNIRGSHNISCKVVRFKHGHYSNSVNTDSLFAVCMFKLIRYTLLAVDYDFVALFADVVSVAYQFVVYVANYMEY